MSEDLMATAKKLFTANQCAKLVENGVISQQGDNLDPRPVVKLFMPGTGMTWLLTELVPEEENIAFGLCDLGMQSPELGYVDLNEITATRTKLGAVVERDLFFAAKKTLSEYTREARASGRISA